MIKKFFKCAVLFAALAFVGTACSKDDDNPNVDDIVEDGWYVVGDNNSSVGALNPKGIMKPGVNEAKSQAIRTGMFEKYVALKANATFNLVEVVGGQQNSYGKGADFAVVTNPVDLSVDYPTSEKVQWGAYAQNGAQFSVDADGLYHIALDKESGKVVIVPVSWAVIGDAVGGWNDVAMTLKAFSLTSMTWEVTGVNVKAAAYKYRHTGGWKMYVNEAVAPVAGDSLTAVRINTNAGGADLTPGGADISFTGEKGKYTISLTWTAGKDWGYTSNWTRTGDSDAPVYPSTMYIVGDGCKAGWNEKNGVPMQPTNGQDGQFWAIAYLNASGAFKFFPTSSWDNGVGAPDGQAAGLGDFKVGGGDIPVPGTEGYYMLVLDMAKDSISISNVAVFGKGDAFGGWDGDGVAFNVNNTTKLISGVATANGNLRSYAKHKWISDWWHSEINIEGTNVVYRGTGGDPAAFPLTAGQIVNYNIDAGTALVQ